MKLFRGIVFLYVFLIFIPAFSQLSKNLSSADNTIRQNLIRCVIRDYKNRIWCGTDNGIFCYDGYDVVSFNNEKGGRKISDNYVLSCAGNADATILVFVTDQGLTWINTISMRSYFYKGNIESKERITEVNPVVHIGNNRFLIASDSKLFLLKVMVPDEKVELSELQLNDKILGGNDVSITFLASDQVNEWLLVKNNTNVSAVNSLDLTEKKQIGPYRSICGAVIQGDAYVITSFDGVSYINKMTGAVKQLPITGITSMHCDHNSNLWLVVNRTNVYKLSVNGELSLIYKMTTDEEARYQHIFCVATDGRSLWMGTSKGLISIILPRSSIQKIITQSEELNSGELSSRGMLQINDTNVLLCGYHYFKSYNPVTGALRDLISKKDAESISPYSLCQTGDSVWIATEGAGIKIFSLKQSKLFNPLLINSKSNKFIENGFLRASLISGNWIYFSEYGFITRINYKTGQIFNSSTHEADQRRNLSGVSRIFKKSDNELIVMNNNSISLIDTNLRVIESIYPAKSKNNEMGILNCMSFHNGKIWIGTASRGLILLNEDTHESKQWSTDDGLSDNTIYSILPNENRLFIGTKNGLSIFDTQKEKFINFFEEDGLSGNEFNANSFLKLRNGDLLMGGVSGVTRIRTKLLDKDSNKSVFYLSKVVVKAESGNLDSVIVGDLENLKNIVLPYEHRFLKVHFTISNYSPNNRFAYKLEGAGSEWIDLGNQNSITLNSLEPGDYVLRVKAWDDKGEIIQGQIVLPIKADQVFYRTTGFVLLLVVVLVTLASLVFYIYYRIKIRNIQRLADLRLKIASELHDQVGGLLNKTAIQAELVSSVQTEKNPQLDKIALNSRTALSSMRDILWNLDPRNDNTASLIDRMKEYVLRMLEDDFEYELKIEAVEYLELPHEMRQNINMIFKEAINNIVKHGHGSRVKIFFGVQNEKLVLSVYSSIPLKSDMISTGQGIRNMRMRAEKIKAQFTFKDMEGVEILIELPLNHIKM